MKNSGINEQDIILSIQRAKLFFLQGNRWKYKPSYLDSCCLKIRQELMVFEGLLEKGNKEVFLKKSLLKSIESPNSNLTKNIFQIYLGADVLSNVREIDREITPKAFSYLMNLPNLKEILA